MLEIIALGSLLVGGSALSAGIMYQIREQPADNAENRRKIAILNPQVHIPDYVAFERGYFKTEEGMNLAYYQYVNTTYKVSKGVIFGIHGYTDSAMWSFHEYAMIFAEQGYAVVTLDLEGHGCSDGLHIFIPSFQRMVSGARQLFNDFKLRKFPNQKYILFGESMGGGVACRMAIDYEQDQWEGLILLAPMAKIAKEMVPPAPVVTVLTKLSDIIPTWPIVPSPDVIDKAYRREEVRKRLRASPIAYKARIPRVKTAVEMLNSTIYLEQNMEKVLVPMLILHGEADVVTSCEISKELHERSGSSDKTLKVYEGMWHSLLEGELPENSVKVWADILAWLNDRV